MKNKYYYILVTNDDLELPVACADTLPKLSAITGISFCVLQHSSYRKESCCHGKYRVHKVFVDVMDYDYNFANYIQFCKDYKLRSCSLCSLDVFHKMSNLDVFYKMSNH